MTYERMTANKAGLVRNGKLEGKVYKIIPMVMAIEGVLNGSNGSLLYPAEELSKVPACWNHKPVIVYHPDMAETACTPEILEAQKVGIIMNTKFSAGKLKAEAWIDPERADAVDPRIMQAVTANQMLELSTGLYTENEETPGTFKGKPYDAIARNYRPDHLAILPDQVGACSIADGAGFLRMNSAGLSAEQMAALEHVEKILMVNNELSHDALYSRLKAALIAKNGKLADKDGSPAFWVADVFDAYFIYEMGAKYFKQAYAVDAADAVTLTGEPVQVARKIVYDVVAQPTQNKGEDMKREEIVNKLIENSAWRPEDREFLMALNDSQLEKLTGTKPLETVPAKSVDELVANAAPEIKAVVMDAMAIHNAKKETLIATITAHPKNTFNKDVLAGKSVGELESIAALAQNTAAVATPDAPAPKTPETPAVHIGSAAGVTNADAGEILVAPTFNFEKKSK